MTAVSLKVAAPGDEITFQGSYVDNDGTVTGYEWRSDIDGILSSGIPSDPNTNTFSTDLLSPGTHTIFFRVQDDQNAWSKEAVALVVVRDCNSPVTIMPLGDSITYGVSEISGVDLITGFRQPLFQSLKSAGYYVDFVGDRSTGLLVAPPFDIDHQGVPGITASEVASNVYNWLIAHPAEIVLLHIGTNDIEDGTDPALVESYVKSILDEIDRYETVQNKEVTVVLARIINHMTYNPDTTTFNNNVQAMAEARIAAGDKIVMVDQESALNYATDMWNNLHPNTAGYNKMDDVWLNALTDLLPVCSDFGPFIFTTPSTGAMLGYPYTYNLGALGNPTPTYSLLVGAPGMSIDPTTGVISWIPASGQEGVHDITVQAQNSEGTDTQNFSIDVSGSIIIDNGDPETSFEGSWGVSGGADPWDPIDPSATSLWSRDGDTYTWTFTPLVSGDYEVSMWWTQYSSRSTSIPVSIEYSGGGDTVPINQQTDGGKWNILRLTPYPFVAGESYDITITSQPGPTSTSADAVKFVLVSTIPPSITSHPSNQIVTEGEAATFSVAATGSAPLSYQWQKGGVNIPGATGATYIIPVTVLGDNGAIFSCVVSNAVGSATSNPATLTVNAAVAPSITSHPSNQTVPEGSTATFSVAASGSAPLSYQWQKGGVNIPGATGATYTTPACVLLDSGALFRCKVTNIVSSVTSSNGTLTVTAVAPSITSHPSNQTVTQGSTATFSVAASGSAPLSYQWQKNGSDISGATVATYTTPAAVLTDNGTTFRCMVSNAAGSVPSDAATLTVNAAVAPSVTSHPSNQTVTLGETATFSVAASGSAPLSYQWQKGGSDISGATGATYTTPATVLTDDGVTFRCVVSNIAGDDTSNSATLTVVTSAAPVAFNDKMDAWVGVPVTVDVVANDTDSDGSIDPTTVSITTGPANGTAVEQGNGTVLYTPNAGYSGKDTFMYTVRDDQGVLSNTATATVTVGIVIDNGDPETSFTGSWDVSGGADPFDPADPGATSVWSRDGDTYTWTFTPDVSGNYEISIWYTYMASRGINIPVEIENWHGTDTRHINQQIDPGQWNNIGTYAFEAGTSYDITIISPDGGAENYSTCADAVRFVHIPTNVAPLASIGSMSPNPALPNQTVTFSGSGTDFEGTVVGYSWYSTLDGPLSDQASFSTSALSEGVHTILFKVQDNTGAWSSEIQTTLDVNNYNVETTEHIFFAPGYATDYGMPVMVAALQDMGATLSGGVWTYRNTDRNKRYIIHPVDTNQEYIDALKWQDSVVLYWGHSNYGLGGLFATEAESNAGVIEDILYVDDDRIINMSSPVVHVNINGMRTGQAYPHWWPIYKDGTSAVMPYDWGDPNGDPAYNYYPTYQVPGDPTYYKIETVHNSAIERFPDWGGPAWYDPNGNPPDPTNPDHLQYYITNSDPWSPSFERVGNWVDTNVLTGYFRENYEYSSAGTGADQAKWLFSIPEEGDYNVYAWWPASSSNSTSAPYTVNHALGSTTVPKNQRLNGMQWNSLGTFHFGVEDYSVVLTDNISSGRVIADGIRIEHVDNPPEILKSHFFATNRSGPAPLTVSFRAEPIGDVDTFEWTFGDGTRNSTRDRYEKIYTEPGTYTVTYTVWGPLGTDSTTEVGYIVVGEPEEPLQAEFEARSWQTAVAPGTIQFRDRSSGNIVSWEWDFDGDNIVDSTEQSPSFTYTDPGIYAVSLTIKDTNANTDTKIKDEFIRIVRFDKNIDNVDYPKRHYGSKTLLRVRELDLNKAEFKYARMFHGGCDSSHYYTDTFNRGIFHFSSGTTSEGEYAMADYLKAYVDGKSDYEIWQILQSSEPKYDYYNFNKPPSEQW